MPEAVELALARIDLLQDELSAAKANFAVMEKKRQNALSSARADQAKEIKDAIEQENIAFKAAKMNAEKDGTKFFNIFPNVEGALDALQTLVTAERARLIQLQKTPMRESIATSKDAARPPSLDAIKAATPDKKSNIQVGGEAFSDANQRIKIGTLNTTNGETYHDVTVTSITNGNIRFMHNNGIKTLSISVIMQDDSSRKLFESIKELEKQAQLEKEKSEKQTQLEKEKVDKENQIKQANLESQRITSYYRAMDLINAIKNKDPLTSTQLELLFSYGNLLDSQVKSLLGPPDYVIREIWTWQNRATSSITDKVERLDIKFNGGHIESWSIGSEKSHQRYFMDGYPQGYKETLKGEYETVIDSFNIRDMGRAITQP
jgi:hypothetical protein